MQIGDNIYLRQNRGYKIFSDAVHEGAHFLDDLNPNMIPNFGQYSLNPFSWEKRAYFWERQYQVAKGIPVEFESINDMINHIYQSYF